MVQGPMATCAVEPPSKVSTSSTVIDTADAIAATGRLRFSCRILLLSVLSQGSLHEETRVQPELTKASMRFRAAPRPPCSIAVSASSCVPGRRS